MGLLVVTVWSDTRGALLPGSVTLGEVLDGGELELGVADGLGLPLLLGLELLDERSVGRVPDLRYFVYQGDVFRQRVALVVESVLEACDHFVIAVHVVSL